MSETITPGQRVEIKRHGIGDAPAAWVDRGDVYLGDVPPADLPQYGDGDTPVPGRVYVRHADGGVSSFDPRDVRPAAPETVTLTLTRAQLAAVRGALDSRVEMARAEAERCENDADLAEAISHPDEADKRASAARWNRLADDAASALAVVDAAAERVITETHSA